MKDCWKEHRPTLEGVLNALQEELDFEQSHQLDRQELQLLKTLGNGCYSEVSMGRFMER